ncbi:hypothetical protein CORT_0A09710 [Candida orthopsilosis Co 90-125]|uniref:Uncharacterized protein n=1 Tax=Candida orthopsilosis (strain 90-125) TaxID=1136231 RepID=H8WX51_CANO9|nr:hypothetical protein CORT_0A09710 [Candida orthopsilosis Co 90-125]CCG21356.1 hypothetical protein CORT_0A09710 [Candida orthopsilosis Co 90-125]
MTTLIEHLIFYRSYHFNNTNVTIHLICIPIILLSAITFLTPVALPSVSSNPLINVGNVVAWIYGLYYISLDWKVGVPSASVLVTYAYYIGNYYRSLSATSSPTSSEFVNYAIAAHTFAWIAQFYGHGVHEKRAPALLDNLLQALVLAPFFVAFEITFFLGLRKDLKKTMDNEAGKRVRDFRLKEKSQKAKS